ncbi:hypothetical protein R4Z10_09055 [Niallia sp. XMNu-256]|uniref:hypothetical protein n=1 Tax=Niallia sp. XMNu-256 TaxID=3082444 RepID=UPI0030CFC866
MDRSPVIFGPIYFWFNKSQYFQLKIIRVNLIKFASDGAAAITGERIGVTGGM